jgi:hypothetical protein
MMKIGNPLLFLAIFMLSSCGNRDVEVIHVFEIHEVVLESSGTYDNPYKEVECWVELKGPDDSKKIYGFWNGDNKFVFRLAATHPGTWSWSSHSNQEDSGLNKQSGEFRAIAWTEGELKENPNRGGYIRATDNGHALEYADGFPFFMLGDTWWAASTWRYPLKGIMPAEDYVPGEGISFEEAVSFRKRQGFNTIAMIAAYPNWQVDAFPHEYTNADSVGVRQAWEKNGMATSKDMHDEAGNLPFEKWEQSEIIADFDRINPDYFKSLDKKIRHLNNQGFIAFLETVRRDHGPSWKHYFDWPDSFSRYIQYIIARYGAFNIIFSGIHLDWIPEHYSLSADEFNEALTYHYNKYGALPYGQPYTTLINKSTLESFGHSDQVSWLTMHSVGNYPRTHNMGPLIGELYHLNPPYPAANLEPYYPGWDHPYYNVIDGERPAPNSKRDNYFARAQMYGSVLSGGLAGHIYGTGAYDGSTTGETVQEGARPFIWEALNYASGEQMQHLGKFILSEGKIYQECVPASELLVPGKAENSIEEGLDGWAYLLISPQKELAFAYFESGSEIPLVKGLLPGMKYKMSWFDPITGEWLANPQMITADVNGRIRLESFPDSTSLSVRDWSLKMKTY